MEQVQKFFFRDQLRSARAIALASEGFFSLFRVIELMGQQLTGTAKGLVRYKAALSALVSSSPLAIDLPNHWAGYHTLFDVLFEEMRQARNDAVHEGSHARTITDHAVELSLVLEDALMTSASIVSQFMVRNVVDAKPWHPISYIRQQMLTYAFSYLPILYNGDWKLIPEYAIARLLRGASSPEHRRQYLVSPISESLKEDRIELLDPRIVHLETPIFEILQFLTAQPILVVDPQHSDVLAGLLTASDVL